MSEPSDVRGVIRARPSEATLRWVAERVGAGARVDGMMILEGGGACALHALDVFDRDGVRHPLVLKRFVRDDWVAREPDVAEREARILEALAGVPLPTPELVACDPDGSRCDVRAVLMTRLPGRVDLAPEDLDAWLHGLAEPLPVVHAQGPAIRDLVEPYYPYQELAELVVPAWSRAPAAWEALIRVAQSRMPSFEPAFIHRDYHPTNILWTQSRVSAVLDWTNASCGPPGADAGHCRLNLVKLYGVEIAERFREILHQTADGVEGGRDPTWDIFSLIEVLPNPSVYWGWVNLGVTNLTVQLVQSRLDTYAELLASRL